jgi:hypothetical protein
MQYAFALQGGWTIRMDLWRDDLPELRIAGWHLRAHEVVDPDFRGYLLLEEDEDVRLRSRPVFLGHDLDPACHRFAESHVDLNLFHQRGKLQLEHVRQDVRSVRGLVAFEKRGGNLRPLQIAR